MEILAVIWLLSHVACSILAAVVAKSKDRSAVEWFFVGLIFGILGLLAAGFMERVVVEERDKRERRERDARRRQANEEAARSRQEQDEDQDVSPLPPYYHNIWKDPL